MGVLPEYVPVRCICSILGGQKRASGLWSQSYQVLGLSEEELRLLIN